MEMLWIETADGTPFYCPEKGVNLGSKECQECKWFGGWFKEDMMICKKDIEAELPIFDETQPTIGLHWRKCKAGYKFPSDAIVIPDDERTTDRDPRLVRCAVWDSKYILVDELKKLPVENE